MSRHYPFLEEKCNVPIRFRFRNEVVDGVWFLLPPSPLFLSLLTHHFKTFLRCRRNAAAGGAVTTTRLSPPLFIRNRTTKSFKLFLGINSVGRDASQNE